MQAKLLQLCLTLWTVTHQVLLSVGFSGQEYWSVLLCPPPGDLPDPGVEPVSLMPPSLAGRFFTASTTWEAPPNHFVKLVTKKSSDVMLRLFL